MVPEGFFLKYNQKNIEVYFFSSKMNALQKIGIQLKGSRFCDELREPDHITENAGLLSFEIYRAGNKVCLIVNLQKLV